MERGEVRRVVCAQLELLRDRSLQSVSFVSVVLRPPVFAPGKGAGDFSVLYNGNACLVFSSNIYG